MISNGQFMESLVAGHGGPASRCTYDDMFVMQDATGGRHSLALSLLETPLQCPYATPKIPVKKLSGGDDYYLAALTTITAPLLVADAGGTVYTFPNWLSQIHTNPNTPDTAVISASLPSTIEDRNGNILTLTDLGAQTGGKYGSLTVKDTLGRTMISTSGFGFNGDTVSVAGLSNSYTVTWGTTTANLPIHASLVFGNPCGTTLPNYSGTFPAITKITLPNNTFYQFSYDSTYGLVNKITYPTGGYVSYTWGINSLSEFGSFEPPGGGRPDSCQYHYDTPVVLHRYVSFDGVNIALQQDFTYATNWSGNTYAWNTKTTTVKTTDLITGAVSTTAYTYSPISVPRQPNDWSQYQPQVPVEQSSVYKDSGGNTLRTVNKTWFDQYLLNSQQTVLENGLTSQTNYFYGPGAQLVYEDVFDFGNGAPGARLRKTLNTYQAFNATPLYPSTPTIVDKPCQTIVYDSSGTNRVAETDYFYDGSTSTTPCPAATTQTLPGTGSYIGHDETLYGTGASVSRGNLTKVVKLCLQAAPNCAGGNPTTTTIYDETGQITSTTDPNGKVTQFSYADSYTVLSGGVNITYTPSGNTNAFLTKITDPLTHTQNFTYDFNNSQLTISKDQNALSTTYLYNDSFARPTLTTRPDNGTTTAAYNDTANTVTTSKKINTSQTITTVALSDGVGHIKQSQLTSDPQGTVYTDTSYDGFGRAHSVSNPYRTGSDPTTSLGTTTYFYDALGRKCLEVPPDGTQPTGGVCPATQPANDLFTTYSGNTTTVTDQTGKSRKSVTDGAGRLTQVFEAPAGLNYETDYQYDALGNLLCAGQKGTSSGTFTNCASIPAGWHARNFTYDSLSRLLTSNNPEVGTITYKYDLDTNCASPNSFIGLLVSKTDARGIRTCAQYDALNRITQKSYSDGTTPTAFFTYDATSAWGATLTNTVGRLTEQWTGVSCCATAGAEIFSYDPMGRVLLNEQYTPSMSYRPVSYTYDLAGNPTSITYPSGRVVNYTYDSADRPKTAIDGSNGITYATDFQSPPTGCLSGAVCYTPQGTFYALSIGQTSSFTGLNLTHSYNSRLQPNEFKASSTGGLAIDITYGFVDPVTTHNAGHVYSITNNLDTTRSQNFTYDQLNRISSALTVSTHATSPTHCWGESYTLDAWANLNSIAATTNSNYIGCSQESGFSTTADGNNHLPTFSYDPSGNTMNDGVNSYTWDAESQLKTAAGVTYAYDAQGRRVSKSTGKNYIYSLAGDILAETDASGNNPTEYIFFGGKRVAMTGMGVPGTGSATVNGSEQSIAGAPPASGTGSVTFSGTLQSKQVLSHAAASGTGSVSISGGPDQSTSVGYVCGPNGQMCWRTVYDGGSITVTVNGFLASASYYQASTPTTIATSLASALNASGSPVTASSSGASVTMTANTPGSASNYPVSVSVSYDSHDFSHSSFTASGPSALTGGANATYTTVYDSGTDTITVNGHADTVSWSGSGTTTSSIASALASSINADSAASVSASASGASVNLTAKTTGASTNYSLSSSSSYDSTDFTSPSFTSSNSGSALTGGHDAGATVYDSGNVWVTINGTQYSVSYGQGSSSSSIASGLASAISAGSLANATASGSNISITSKSNGAATNYSLSSGSSSSQGSFSSASFTVSTSGSALTGGSGGTSYYVEDLLGTSRVMTTDTGVVCYDADFYPYGGERSYTNTCPQNYKFEGKERDAETGNDDFGARYYSNRFGRWLSADWSAVPAPVPYANLSNPQTLNLYAMVSDDPESFADLDGHDVDLWDVVNFVVGAANAWASDNLLGAGRQQQDTTAGKLGAATGDLVATIQGGERAVAGGTGVVAGVSLSATGEGAAVGVPLAVVSAPVAIQGAASATVGAAHLGVAAADAIKGAVQKSSNKDQNSSGANDKPDTRATKAEKNTLEGAQDQADSISKAKEKLNKTGQGDKIQSTEKSQQRLKNQLKKIQSLKDVEE